MKRRSRFLTFVFSLLPGAGQMYLGFMKQGMTTMAIFFFTIFLTDFFRVSFVLAILPVIWCYGFFDTLNKAGLPPEEFAALEDKSIFEKFLHDGFSFTKKYVWLGAILIFFGVFLLFDNILFPQLDKMGFIDYYIAKDYLRTIIAAAALIGLGFKLIAGKREKI